MREAASRIYRCPYTREGLDLEVEQREGSEILRGALHSAGGRSYPIESGIPRLLRREDDALGDRELAELDYYEANSTGYDAAMDWLFASFFEDEDEVRESMLDSLDLRPGQRALEVGCGTCRDSIHMARRLGGDGQLFLQDLSPKMVALGKDRLSRELDGGCEVEFFVGNAASLPFDDGFFDRAFHFGGLNFFTDVRKALREMGRVVRIGGRVLVGDEGLAPWLSETTYGQILLNSNRLYRHEAPLALLPDGAREVEVRWILGNAFYLVAFTVGEGAPQVDLDLPIPGARGGTHRSRFFGRLEGVSPEAKALMERAARRRGLTLHAWLDAAVREGAAADLEE
jgi:ubiquinone/menaquinone biosynthesis C-methylase UbiE